LPVLADAIGVIRITTGTDSTGAANRSFSSPGLRFDITGNNARLKSRIRVEDLTVASTQEYELFGGFSLSPLPTLISSVTNGAYWFYDKNNTNFILRRRAGTTTTDIDTGIAVVADTWYELELVVTGNAITTSIAIELFIDGVSVASTTTLTGSLVYTPISVNMKKLVGTTARLAYIDYEAFYMEKI
jgi:hypothetical protein